VHEIVLHHYPHSAAQVRAQLGWVNERLAGDRRFMLGDQPGLPDAACYYVVWFVRARWQGGPALLAEFPALEAWEQRVKAIGRGRPTPMTSAEAIVREDPRVGSVCVHFPRVGYRVSVVSS
jgi:glutathione S-transferase